MRGAAGRDYLLPSFAARHPCAAHTRAARRLLLLEVRLVPPRQGLLLCLAGPASACPAATRRLAPPPRGHFASRRGTAGPAAPVRRPARWCVSTQRGPASLRITRRSTGACPGAAALMAGRALGRGSSTLAELEEEACKPRGNSSCPCSATWARNGADREVAAAKTAAEAIDAAPARPARGKGSGSAVAALPLTDPTESSASSADGTVLVRRCAAQPSEKAEVEPSARGRPRGELGTGATSEVARADGGTEALWVPTELVQSWERVAAASEGGRTPRPKVRAKEARGPCPGDWVRRQASGLDTGHWELRRQRPRAAIPRRHGKCLGGIKGDPKARGRGRDLHPKLMRKGLRRFSPGGYGSRGMTRKWRWSRTRSPARSANGATCDATLV